MVELDKRSNPEYYQKIWAEIEAGEKYKVNKDEADYLKLFLPREKFALLNNADNAIDQVEILKEYIKAACEAIVEGGK